MNNLFISLYPVDLHRILMVSSSIGAPDKDSPLSHSLPRALIMFSISHTNFTTMPQKQTSTVILLTVSLKRTSASVSVYCLQMPRAIIGNSSKFQRRYELHIDVGSWAVEKRDFCAISCHSFPGLLSGPLVHTVPKFSQTNSSNQLLAFVESNEFYHSNQEFGPWSYIELIPFTISNTADFKRHLFIMNRF